MLLQKRDFRKRLKLPVNYLIALPMSSESKSLFQMRNSKKIWNYWKRRLLIVRNMPKINSSVRWIRMPEWARKPVKSGRVTKRISSWRKRQVLLPE